MTREAEKRHRLAELEAALVHRKVSLSIILFHIHITNHLIQNFVFWQPGKVTSDNRRLEAQVEDLIIDTGEKKVKAITVILVRNLIMHS